MIDAFIIIASAIVIETLMEVIKGISPRELSSPLIRLLTLAIGIGFAANFQLELLSLFGFVGRAPLVDIITTGILIGGGSNVAYDMITTIEIKRKEYDTDNTQE